MSLLRRMIAPFLPAPRVSTDAEILAVEREIELDEVPVWVLRARQWVGQGHYCLGSGGKDPRALSPWTKCAKPKIHSHAALGARFSDCSGFVDFCLGWDRNDPVYGWRYCDSLFADAKKQVPGDLGYEVPIISVRVGDIVVYRSKDIDGDGDRDIIGHIGIVDFVPTDGPVTWRTIRVIHCSSRPVGDPAVKRTDGRLWEKTGVVFRVR